MLLFFAQHLICFRENASNHQLSSTHCWMVQEIPANHHQLREVGSEYPVLHPRVLGSSKRWLSLGISEASNGFEAPHPRTSRLRYCRESFGRVARIAFFVVMPGQGGGGNRFVFYFGGIFWKQFVEREWICSCFCLVDFLRIGYIIECIEVVCVYFILFLSFSCCFVVLWFELGLHTRAHTVHRHLVTLYVHIFRCLRVFVYLIVFIYDIHI